MSSPALMTRKMSWDWCTVAVSVSFFYTALYILMGFLYFKCYCLFNCFLGLTGCLATVNYLVECYRVTVDIGASYGYIRCMIEW